MDEPLSDPPLLIPDYLTTYRTINWTLCLTLNQTLRLETPNTPISQRRSIRLNRTRSDLGTRMRVGVRWMRGTVSFVPIRKSESSKQNRRNQWSAAYATSPPRLDAGG